MNKHIFISIFLLFCLSNLAQGQYAVQYSGDSTFFNTHFFSQFTCGVIVDAGADIYICDGDLPVQLDGSVMGSSTGFSWTSDPNLDDPSILNPMVSATGTYTLTAQGLEINLINNGDFEQGDTGFTSDYTPGNSGAGNYLIADTPEDYISFFSDCSDHTTGSGNMIVIDGSTNNSDNIWCQTVNVTPNTDYIFSYWVTMVGSAPLPELFVTIDGMVLGNPIIIPSDTCSWTEISNSWNSQSNTSVEFCIGNMTAFSFGNDFAIDDIFLSATCEVTDDVEVILLEANAVAQNATIPCEGDCIQLDGSGSTSGTNVTYEWTTTSGGTITNETTLMPTVCESGTYQLTVTHADPNNTITCQDVITVTVDLGTPDPLEPTFDGEVLVCEGATETYTITSIDPNASTYQWDVTGGTISSGQGSNEIEVSWTGTTGDVCVVAENTCGTSTQVCLNITIEAIPTQPDISGPTNICIDPIATYSTSTITGVDTYVWTVPSGVMINSGDGTASIMVDWGTVQGGDICLEIINDCGNESNCVTVSFGNVQVDINSSDPLCDGDANGFIKLTPLTGTPTHTFLWDGGETVDSIFGLSANNYTVTVTDADGCSTVEMITLTNPSPLSLTLSPTEISCYNDCDGSISTTVNGGTSPYTYLWSDGSTTDNISDLCAGTHTVTVTDANDCTIEDQVILDNPPEITASISQDATICEGEQVDIEFTFTGVGPFDIELSDGSIFTNLSTGDIEMIAPTSTTTISIISLTDNGQSGCSGISTSSILITVNELPETPIIDGLTAICDGTTVTYCMTNIANINTFDWSVPADATFTGQGTSCIDVDWTGSAGGDVCVEATNDCGSETGCLSITVNENPTSNFSVDPVICVDSTSTITYTGSASSNAIFTWDFGGGIMISGSGSGPFEIQWLTVGDQTVTLTVEENGCTSPLSSETIDIDGPIPAPVINCTSTTNSITFTWDDVPGATSYQVNDLSGTGGMVIGNMYTVTGLANGQAVTIEVIAMGNSTCGNTSVEATCQADDCPTVNVEIMHIDPICLENNLTPFDLTATITGGTNGTSTWTGNGITNGTTGTFDPAIAGPGIHDITLTYEENSCPYVDVVTIEIFDIPTADFTVDGNICITESATITYQGTGTSGASFIWNFDGGDIISGNASGPYEITWPDSGIYNITLTVEENGCISSSFSQIVQVDTLLIEPIITCNSTTQSIIFTWDDVVGATGYMINDISGLAGTLNGNSYEVTGLTTGQQVDIELIVMGTTVCGDLTIPMTCFAQNCPNISVEADPVNAMCFSSNLSAFDMTGTITGGDNSGVITWSGNGITDAGLGTFDPQVAGVGNHNITMSYEQDNCTFTDVAVVEIFATPTADLTLDGNICLTNSTIITYQGTGSSGASFVWGFDGGTINSGNAGGPFEVSWLDSGIYNITLTVEENGCFSEPFSQAVQVDAELIPPAINCNSTTQSVTFTWDAVAGATGYSVNDISGPAGTLNGTTYEINGLSIGQTVDIELIVEGTTACGNLTIPISCSADNCPPITVAIDAVDSICLTTDFMPFDLSAVVTGGNNSGVGTWSGDGIIDATIGTFDPQVAGAGNHNITYSYEQDNCTYSDILIIEIFAIPTSDFIVNGVICVTDSAMITYQGTASPLANYTWDFDGGTVLSGTGVGPYEVSWVNAGNYNITLTVEENGCISSSSTEMIQVDAELGQLNISCNATTNSVVFSWENVAGADTYQVNEIVGTGGIQNGNTYEFANLNPNDAVTIEVVAMGSSVCGVSTLEATCAADNCPTISLALNPLSDICLETTTNAIPLNVTVNGSDGSGAGSWSGLGVANSEFDPQIAGEGIHKLIYSFSELQCDFEDSIFVNVMLQPIAIAGDNGHLDCNQTTIVLNGENSSSFANPTWTTNIGSFVNGEFTLTPTINLPGTYYLFLENGGCSAMDSLVITQNIAAPIADAGLEKLITCDQLCVNLGGANTSTGSTFTYEWTGPNNFSSTEISPEVCLPGQYTLMVLDNENGCFSTTSSVLISEDTTTPIANIEAFGNLDCNTSALVLDGTSSSSGSNFVYQWSNDNGVISNAQNVIYEATTEGNYYLQVLNNATGCIAYDTVFVNDIVSYPVAEIAVPDMLTCENLTVDLDGSASSNFPSIVYDWSGPAGGIQSGNNTNTVIVNLPGEYEMTVLDMTNGCKTTTSVLVLQNIIVPSADAGQDIELDCNDISAMLGSENTSSGNNFVYTWTSSNPNATISDPSVLNPIITGLGTYTLTVVNTDNGCTATDEIEISQSPDIPQVINLESFDPRCHGDENGSIAITSVEGGDGPYLFSLNGNPFSGTNFYQNLAPDEYQITIQDANGCELSTNVTLVEPDSLSINLGDDIYLELGDSVMLDPTTTGSFDTLFWDTSIPYSNCDGSDLCWNPIFTPTSQVNVVATVMDEKGCKDEDRLMIFVEKNRYVYIPNAFSPEGHPDNRMFMIYAGKGVVKVSNFQIFGRWGEKIYESKDFLPNDASYGWDGTFKGKKLDPGVFVYFAEIEFSDGLKIIYKGDVTLVR